MTKPPVTTPKTVKTTKVLYHCRCYKVGDEYEMWVLDPKSGTYNGPIPCTEQQCRKCNMSEAEVVSGDNG
jgi:hypothetical protein